MNDYHFTDEPAPLMQLCKILTEEAEKQAKLVAMKERIGPKVFDWVC